MAATRRLKELDRLIMQGVQNSQGQMFSIETLFDCLLVLYDECSNSTLCREKSISEFLEYGKSSNTILVHIFTYYSVNYLLRFL